MLIICKIFAIISKVIIASFIIIFKANPDYLSTHYVNMSLFYVVFSLVSFTINYYYNFILINSTIFLKKYSTHFSETLSICN